MRCVRLKNRSKFAQVPTPLPPGDGNSLPHRARHWVLTWQAVKFIKRKTIIKAK